jgi:hypothetical protein
MDWQPIETAPKDGTRVLLYWPHWCEEAITGKWSKRNQWESTVVCADCGPDPTHWMPLPAPPKKQEDSNA